MKTRTHRNGAAPHRNGSVTPVVRVAIYTRQSVTEAKDQEFGSIQAQRESGEAYVLVQRHRGWSVAPERYDDAGFTGANIERPAFQRLLADIRAGRIQCVVVNKIDRLSRSLADFTALMREFEARGVAFVSTTQSFDTATVTGRLLLNILASFAEFERGTIAERTRDKVQAARRKGRWTGGHPPLGYDVVEGKLVVNEEEAERVRAIFRFYVEDGTLQGTVAELERREWSLKSWTTQEGKEHRGAPFTKTTLDAFLSNAVVLGKIRAGAETVAGQHEPIVDQALFDGVQAQRAKRERPGFTFRGKNESFLRGLVRCGACQVPMYPHFAQSHGRRQHSYVCKRILDGNAAACPGSRAPARELERIVVEKIRAVGRDPALVKATVEAAGAYAEERRGELEDVLRKVESEERQLLKERTNLVDAIAQGKGARAALTEKLEEVQQGLDAAAKAAADARAERALLESQTIDEDDLRRAVAAFDPVWSELFPAERSRVAHLLLEAVVVYPAENKVELAYRAAGIRALANETPEEAA